MTQEHRVSVNGRNLAVVEAGNESGPAVVLCHGTPGSRLLWRELIEDAEERGMRLLSYDRPGYGGSDPHPGRTAADAAGDVIAIADALDIEQLAVEGGSGGGPHTLACAALLPERVVAAASLAGVAPYEAGGLDWLEGMGQETWTNSPRLWRGARPSSASSASRRTPCSRPSRTRLPKPSVCC